MNPRSKKPFTQLIEQFSTNEFIHSIAGMCANERLDMAKNLCDLAEEAQKVSDGLVKFKSCPDMMAQSDRLLLVSIVLTQIAERILDSDEPEKLWNCQRCGSDKGTWFSRVMPMGNFCENCGECADAP